MRILIAYDGSEGAEAALDDLTRAGLPREAEALMMVTDVWMVASQGDFTRAVARRRQLSAETSSFAPALRSIEEERTLTREATRRLAEMRLDRLRRKHRLRRAAKLKGLTARQLAERRMRLRQNDYVKAGR